MILFRGGLDLFYLIEANVENLACSVHRCSLGSMFLINQKKDLLWAGC